MNFLGKYHKGFGIVGCPEVSSGSTGTLLSNVIDSNSGGSNMEGPPRRSTSLQIMEYKKIVPATNIDKICGRDIDFSYMKYDDDVERKELLCSRFYVNESCTNGIGQLMDMKMDEKVLKSDYRGIYGSINADVFPTTFCSTKNHKSGYVEANDCFDIHIGILSDDDYFNGENVEGDGDNKVPAVDAFNTEETQHDVESLFEQSQSQVVSVRTQVLNFVADARAAYFKLEDEVNLANGRLQTMHHPAQKVSEEIMGEIKDHLIDNVEWLLAIFEEKDKSLERLRRENYDDVDDKNAALIENVKLRQKLEEEKAKPMGISASNQKKMLALGVNNISELINRYRLLQVKVEDLDRRRTIDSPLSRVDSTATFDSEKCEKEFQRPKTTTVKGIKGAAALPEYLSTFKKS